MHNIEGEVSTDSDNKSIAIKSGKRKSSGDEHDEEKEASSGADRPTKMRKVSGARKSRKDEGKGVAI